MRTIIALAMVITASVANAQKGYLVIGVGNSSCGNWTQERKARRPNQATPTGFAYESWLSGFISAYNYFGSPSGNLTRGTDVPGIQAWIDQYCASHPLDSITKAALALISELSAKDANQ